MEESLGQHLHQLRVERGYSLEQIAEKTCVNLPYLKALEDNDFSRLPHAEVFAKSYVHAYCEYLSADETTAMTLFAEAAGKFYKVAESARIPKHEELPCGFGKECHRRGLVCREILAVGV